MATFTPEQFAAQGGTITQPTTGNAYQNFLNNAKTTGFQNTPQEGIMSKFSNAVSGMAKDALNTLVVKPATRIAQAGVQTYNDFQNPGYDTAVDTGNPTRKNAGGTATSIASPTQPTQTKTGNSETKLQQPSTSLGITNEPQQTGVVGAKQIAGQALKSASYLIIPEAAEETTAATSLESRILTGAKAGAEIGATGGAGGELENPNSTADSVLEATGKGALTGAAVGATIPVAVEGTKVGSQAIQDLANKPEVAKIEPKTLEQENLTQAQQTAKEAETKANITQQERQAAAEQGVKGVQEINTKTSGYKTQLGKDFANGAVEVEKVNPNLKLNLTNKQIETLNALKENKNFTLPDEIQQAQELQASLPKSKFGQIKLSGKALEEFNAGQKATQVSLSPTKAQNLITELDKSTFKSDASSPSGFSVDHQRIGITNEIKNAAQEAFGDNWKSIYSKYSQGRAALDKIDNFINLSPRADASEVNKQLEGILKLTDTPEGQILAKQHLDEFAKTSGIDLNDPVKAIKQIADKQTALDEANKAMTDSQKAVAKAQRDIDITKLEKEIKQQTFKGRHPQISQTMNFMGRRAAWTLTGGLLTSVFLYAYIRKLMSGK